MNNLPKDPVMLLSVVNTNLRDFNSNLDEFCKAKDADKQELINAGKIIRPAYKNVAKKAVYVPLFLLCFLLNK